MPQRRTGISTTEEAAWYAREPEAEFEPQRGLGLRRLALFASGATVVAGLVLIVVIFFAGSPSARAGREIAVAQAQPHAGAAAAEAAPEPIEAKPQTAKLGDPPDETDTPAAKPAEAQIKRSAKHARASGKKSSPAKRPLRHGHLTEVR